MARVQLYHYSPYYFSGGSPQTVSYINSFQVDVKTFTFPPLGVYLEPEGAAGAYNLPYQRDYYLQYYGASFSSNKLYGPDRVWGDGTSGLTYMDGNAMSEAYNTPYNLFYGTLSAYGNQQYFHPFGTPLQNSGITIISVVVTSSNSLLITVDIPDQYVSSAFFYIWAGAPQSNYGNMIARYYPPYTNCNELVRRVGGEYQFSFPTNFAAHLEPPSIVAGERAGHWVEIEADGQTIRFDGPVERVSGFALYGSFCPVWKIPITTRFSSAPRVRYCVINNNITICGQWSLIQVLPLPRFKILPVDADTVVLDASESFSLIGQNPLTYHWVLPIGSTVDVRTVNAQKTVSFASANRSVEDSTEEDYAVSSYPIYLSVSDSTGFGAEIDGRYFYVKRQNYILTPTKRIDAFTDPHGVMFSAVKEATGVRVSRFPNGTASRELLALVPNLSSPSLWQHNTQAGVHQESEGTIYLLGKDATANIWKMFVSDDDGESFDFMANTPFDGTYKVISAPIGHDRVGLIAVKGTAVSFARTPDGVSYDAFGNGTQINSVGDLGASVKALSFHSEFAFGTDYLKVSNGVDWACGSDDGGDTWDVI